MVTLPSPNGPVLNQAIRHRPWAGAAPDFAIGLRPIAPDAWLEGEETDPAARKDALFETRLEAVWAETEGSRAGQGEILDLVRRFVQVESRPDLPPLQAAARAVADDLCLMERRNGAWTLTALSLCAGTFFSAGEVIGKSLSELHAPAPGFGERFATRVARIFDALRPNAILERQNWTVMAGDDLFAPDGDAIRARVAGIPPEAAAEALFVRVERQTIRKLPATSGIVFTIRVWRHALAALDAEPALRAAFARAWRTARPDFRRYKRFSLYDPLVEAFLAARGE